MRVGVVVDLGQLVFAHEPDEQAVVCADPVFAGLALHDLPDLEMVGLEDGRDRHVDRFDQQDLPVAGGSEDVSVLGRLDVGQAVGERRGVETVPALVVAVEGAVGEDDPHGVIGIHGDVRGTAAWKGIFPDQPVLFYIAVNLVSRDPDVALLVRLQVEGHADAEPAERFGESGVGIVPAHALRGREPDQTVLILTDIHTGHVGHPVGSRLVGAAEIVAVETGQAVARADPHEAETVLIRAVDGVGGQALAGGVMLEIEERSRLRRSAEEAGYQQKKRMIRFHLGVIVTGCKLAKNPLIF